MVTRQPSPAKASATARREFNRSAALMLERHPLGVGLNNFPMVLTLEPDLRALAESLEHGGVPRGRFHEREADAPLPRAY